ncbi:hypothetical protein G7046_g412 [Stylonectria norvegica]|nr:hypothetical protein G7046_g412 [Stylonectria norvegica]
MANTDHESVVPTTPQWYMLEFTFSINDTDATMIALCNGRRVIVHLVAENFSSSPSLKEKYLFSLQVAHNFELEGYTVEDFWDWIAEPLLPVFREMDALESTPNSLDIFFFPETHAYTLRADGDSLAAIPHHGGEPEMPMFGISLSENHCSSWPSFKTIEVKPCRTNAVPGRQSPVPAKVLLQDGTVAFLKLMRYGDRSSLLNELDTYGKIRDAHLDQALRISRLLGMVRDDTGQVLGLLLTYVDCERRTLFCATKSETDYSQRLKWAGQIDHTIAHLHDAGVAWGDAKPDNVLIDRHNDAWLIDFGGSYTEGWVPRELAGTVEGDLVALGKIKDFLGIK